MQSFSMLISIYSESAMNGYVTKKESIRLFKTDREEQRSKSFVRGRKNKEGGKSFDETLNDLIREFRGEVVSSDKMSLFPLEN